MDLSSFIAILLGGLGSLVLWLILGPIMTGYGFKKLVQKAIDGDEKSMQVFENVGDLLMHWATTKKYETGKIIKIDSGEKDADGRPVLIEAKESLTPIESLTKSIGTFAFEKARSSAAGVKSQLGAQFQNELREMGLGPSPQAIAAAARGNIGPLAAEVVLPFVLDKLKKRNITQDGDTGAQGGWWNR